MLFRREETKCYNFRVKLLEVMILKLRYNFWLEKNEKKTFGDGPLDILHRVEKTGSLRQAAEEINMSYSQAWNLMKDLEKRLGFNLLKRKVGGERGGGSEITEEAGKVMTNSVQCSWLTFYVYSGRAKRNLRP